MNPYQSYLGWGLNNYEDFIEAFTEYNNGGYWIRKIVYKDAFHREITEGPYKEKEAKEKASEWNKFFKYKGLKVAKVYSLLDLICQHNKDHDKLKDYLYSEYIWRPPEGADLLCLLKNVRKAVLYRDKMIKDNYNLEKFKDYVLEKGIAAIKTKDYTIYYKNKDYVSVERAKKLKKLVNDFYEEPEVLFWLYLEASNISSYREGIEPIIIPDYIKDYRVDIVPQSLDFFKLLNNYKDRESKIKCLFLNLKPYGKNILAKDNTFTMAYTLPLLYDKKDANVKNINFSYRDKKLTVFLEEEDYKISLIDSPEKDARIFFDFPYTKKIDFFDDRLIDLLLFIAKVLKVKKVILKDNLQQYCKCKSLDNMPLYLNIIRFLAGEDSIYEEIGFIEIAKDKRKRIVAEYAKKIVNKETDSEGIVTDYTFEDLAKDYFKDFCKYNYVCEILNKNSVEIFEKLKDCCLEYSYNLDNVKLFNLKERLTN